MSSDVVMRELLWAPHFAGARGMKPLSLGTNILSSEIESFLCKQAIIPVPMD